MIINKKPQIMQNIKKFINGKIQFKRSEIFNQEEKNGKNYLNY